MERNSGVTFNQAQVALARQWVGDSADPSSDPAEVTIKSPEPTKEGIVVTEKTEVKATKYQMPRTYDEARDIVARFESGARGVRGDDDVADTVGQHALQDDTNLRDEQWLGMPEEELDWYVPLFRACHPQYLILNSASYVSELSYIHTKLMIVDDRRVIVSFHPWPRRCV
jgi:phospholipase D1/2